MVQPLSGQVADGCKMEAVFQARLPISILLALACALKQSLDALAAAAHFQGLACQAHGAKIVEIDRVGKQARRVGGGALLGQIGQEAEGSIDDGGVFAGGAQVDAEWLGAAGAGGGAALDAWTCVGGSAAGLFDVRPSLFGQGLGEQLCGARGALGQGESAGVFVRGALGAAGQG
jgi:hypothetical protein